MSPVLNSGFENEWQRLGEQSGVADMGIAVHCLVLRLRALESGDKTHDSLVQMSSLSPAESYSLIKKLENLTKLADEPTPRTDSSIETTQEHPHPHSELETMHLALQVDNGFVDNN